MQSKYPKIFENEKSQLPTSLLLQFNRHNSTDSLNSLQSMFSQRSFQSCSTNKTTHQVGGSLSQPPQAGCELKNGLGCSSITSGGGKKRSWLRSSFSRAFSRKAGGNAAASPQPPSSGQQQQQSNAEVKLSSSTGGDKKQFLSDVDENELMNGGGGGSAARLDNYCFQGGLVEGEETFSRCTGGGNGYGGEYSLPNSPLHQQMIYSQNSM
jgi:hypothetical protein